jgi:hypothetical protein
MCIFLVSSAAVPHWVSALPSFGPKPLLPPLSAAKSRWTKRHSTEQLVSLGHLLTTIRVLRLIEHTQFLVMTASIADPMSFIFQGDACNCKNFSLLLALAKCYLFFFCCFHKINLIFCLCCAGWGEFMPQKFQKQDYRWKANQKNKMR